MLTSRRTGSAVGVPGVPEALLGVSHITLLDTNKVHHAKGTLWQYTFFSEENVQGAATQTISSRQYRQRVRW